MHSFLSVPATLFISKGDLGVCYFKEVKSSIHLTLVSHKRDIGKQKVASDQALHCLVLRFYGRVKLVNPVGSSQAWSV